MRRDNPDKSAKEIYPNLEREGWMVLRIARAVEKKKGVPDAIVAGRAGINHLVEIKSPGGHLSPEQIGFAVGWPGCKHVGSTSWEINLLLIECEERHRHR